MLAFETKKVIKEFGGVCAVDSLSIRVEQGKITGIIGPNGSGKTTLTNILTGIHRMDGGEIMVGGGRERTRIHAHEAYGAGLTRTFQNVRLFEQISVLDNVLVALTSRSVFRSLFERKVANRIEKAEALLKRVDLYDKRDANASELSYGQRKLLEIARALATDAEIIFFDEPYAGLFPEMVKLVSGIMRELREAGKTVVLIEHDMALIRALCDHVIVMDAGRLLAEGTPAEVLGNKTVIEAYLGD